MPPRDREPLLRVNTFEVLIGDRELGFSHVGPLTSETDLETPLDRPPHRFAPVTLRRALTSSHELYDWRRAVIDGRPGMPKGLVGGDDVDTVAAYVVEKTAR